MKMRTDEGDKTQKNLIIGIVLYGIVVQIVLLVLHRDLLWYSAGLWIGALSACLMVWHMRRSIEEALDMGEEGALGHVRKTYVIRLIALIAVIVITMLLRIGSILTLFIGVMGLKVSAYLQPYLNKF